MNQVAPPQIVPRHFENVLDVDTAEEQADLSREQLRQQVHANCRVSREFTLFMFLFLRILEKNVRVWYLNWKKAKPAPGLQPARPARRALDSGAHLLPLCCEPAWKESFLEEEPSCGSSGSGKHSCKDLVSLW